MTRNIHLQIMSILASMLFVMTSMTHAHSPLDEDDNFRFQGVLKPTEAPTLDIQKGERQLPIEAIDDLFFEPRDGTPRYLEQCTIDFNDPDSLGITESTLWFDRIYLPWYQNCGPSDIIHLRQQKNSHFHVGFANDDVLPCVEDPQAFPSRIQEDGSCEFVDIRNEPRTRLVPHTDDEHIVIRVTYSGEAIPFDLNQIDIGSNSVRLCYTKATDSSFDDWLADELDQNTSPGLSFCWDNLSPATWDLSEWAWDIIKVNIFGKGNDNFSLDNIKIGLP